MNKSKAAEFLGVSVRAVERYASAGRLPSQYIRGKTGQVLDFDKSDLETFKTDLETPVSKATTSHAEARQSPAADESPQSPTSPENSALATFGGPSSGAAIVAAIVAQTVKEIEAQRAPVAVKVESKLLLTIAEAQQLTGLSRAILRAAIGAGDLDARQIGRAWRIRRSELERFVETL